MARAIIRTVVGNAITAGGPTQDFTVSGIGTPKAAIVIITRQQGTYGVDPQAKLCIGVTDGTFQGGVAAQNQDAVATSECNHKRYDNALVILPSNDGTSDVAVGVFDSWITDGIRINWTTLPGADYQVFVTLFAGDDLTAAAGTAIPTTTVGQDVKVTTGFEPDHLFSVAAIHGDANETYERAYHICLAHAVNLASTPEGGTGARVRGIAWRHNDGLSTSAPTLTLLDAELAIWWASNAVPITYNRGTRLSTTTPWESDGFNIQTTAGPNTTNPGPRLFYLALNYGGKRVQLGDFVSPSSATTQALDLGMKPDSFMGVMTNVNPSGSTWGSLDDHDGDAAEVGGPFFADASTRWSISVQVDSGLSTTDTYTRTANQVMLMTNAAPLYTNILSATLASLDDDGLTLSWGTGSERRFMLFAIETENVVGDGSVIAPAAVVSGAGGLTISVAGVIAAPAGEVAAAGAMRITGSGAIVAQAPVVAGAGAETLSGAGSVAAPVPIVAAAGEVRISGTGAIVAPAPEVSGEGSSVSTVTGVGAVVAPAPAVAGAGAVRIAGAGEIAAPAPEVSAVGAMVVQGSGSIVAQAPEVSGVGAETISGAATIVAPPPDVSGLGAETISGSGSIVAPAPIVSGAGSASGGGAALEGCDVALSGSWSTTRAMAGSSDVAKAMAGQYDAAADLRGSIC